MKQCLFAIGLLLICLPVAGQASDENAKVMEPINQLFSGMKLGDSAMVRSAFTKTISMATVGLNKKGEMSISHEASLHDFLKAVGTKHTEIWNEVIWDTKIQIDGNMAQAWAPYAFYVDKKFSHCGVDAFQLYKGSDGAWKIFHLADTRQKKGCNVPTEISDKFK